ncbi:MAG: DUF2996 domain-containing protein [Leptolyngbyaceae cyanobacterium CSU_1_3]|nr:DUF2996 domain-containing protein [Leptolyngbyaceae cyanobacterium CSU_1_3]
MAEATNHNEAGEVAPSTVEKQAPDVAENNAPSTDSPKATAIPTANAPDPAAVSSTDSPNAAKPKTGEGAEAKPAAKAKKEKPPAIEDKPFGDFIQQDYLPALKKGLASQGVQDVDLVFEKKPIAIAGYTQNQCWQIVGKWQAAKQPRQFNIYFFDETINGLKGFSCAESTGKPSTMESFLIDERKASLDLLVFGAVQRLNGQKWLTRN